MLNGLPILNTFPDLLALEPLAPFILRIVLGLILMNTGYLKWKKEESRWKLFIEAFGLKHRNEFVKILGSIEFIAGFGVLIGLYTQLCALILTLIIGIELYAENKESSLVKRDIVFYILIFAISLSLLFTGAGAFSLDLPL